MSELAGYDEKKAVKFIRRELPSNVNEEWSDDEILAVCDLIWDYYEEKGYLSLDMEMGDEDEVDAATLTSYVQSRLEDDHQLVMDPEGVALVVKAELDYEESIEDIF